MVSATLRPPSDAAAAVELGCDYLASEAHYLSVAGRICGALRDGGLVLVAGDPPGDPHHLSEALRAAAQSHRAVIGVPFGPGLTADALAHAGSPIDAPAAVGDATAKAEISEGTRPLYVFEEADRLSEQQLAEICKAVQSGARKGAAGVLLARPSFLTWLEDPSRRFLKAVLAGQLRFDEISEDERIDFLRHRIASRQTRDEARGISPAFFHGLAVFAVLSTIGIGALLAVHYFPVAGTTTYGSLRTMQLPPAERIPPASPTATVTETTPPAETTSIIPAARPLVTALPAAIVQPTPPAAAPSLSSGPQSQAGQSLSPAEVAALLTRGDSFLASSDIASARLFYERAANAGNGAAALRLGATFDPAFLGRAGLRGTSGDPAQAAAWYRRARDLGAAAAERPNIPERQPAAGSGSAAR